MKHSTCDKNTCEVWNKHQNEIKTHPSLLTLNKEQAIHCRADLLPGAQQCWGLKRLKNQHNCFWVCAVHAETSTGKIHRGLHASPFPRSSLPPCSFYNLDTEHLIHCGSPGLGTRRSCYPSATPRESHVAHTTLLATSLLSNHERKKYKHDSRFQATSKQFEFSKNTVKH